MRKIYQSAPDVPQSVANRAIDIIERQFTVDKVSRAEELPEESKIHLLRELEVFFRDELPPVVKTKDGDSVYDWKARKCKGFIQSVIRWLEDVIRPEQG